LSKIAKSKLVPALKTSCASIIFLGEIVQLFQFLVSTNLLALKLLFDNVKKEQLEIQEWSLPFHQTDLRTRLPDEYF
jgi:hypothetical protein